MRFFRRKEKRSREPGEPEPTPEARHAEPLRGRTANDVLRELEAEVAKAPGAAADPDLGRCLLAEGPITRDFLHKQLAVGGKADTYLGRILAQTRAPNAAELFEVLASGYRIPEVDLKQCKVHVATARSIPREVALKYKIVPIDRIGDLLCVVFAGKPNPKGIEAVRRTTGLRVKALRCPPHHLKILLRRLYLSAPAAPAVAAVPISEQEYNDAIRGLAGRAEARWEGVHASPGPIRATQLVRR